jgi:hypothetical protein
MSNKVGVTVRRQPFGTCEVAFPGAPRSGWLTYGIDAENQKSCFIPLRPVAFGIEEITIGVEMLFVVIGRRLALGASSASMGAVLGIVPRRFDGLLI